MVLLLMESELLMKLRRLSTDWTRMESSLVPIFHPTRQHHLSHNPNLPPSSQSRTASSMSTRLQLPTKNRKSMVSCR